MLEEPKVSNITKVNQELFIMGNASKKLAVSTEKYSCLVCVCVNMESTKCFNNLVSTEVVKADARLEMM